MEIFSKAKIMPSSKISIMVIDYDDWKSWKNDCYYRQEWPVYNSALFLKADEAIQKFDIEKCKKICVSSQATAFEVIAEARKHFPGFDQDNWKPSQKTFGGKYAILYCMYYPALSDDVVSGHIAISELDLCEGDLIVIRKVYQEPPARGERSCIAFVKHFEDFQEIVLNNKNLYEDKHNLFRFNAIFDVILLYTDEDIELAKYVREHLDELHQMSGSDTTVYVVEAPQGKNHAAAFWKARLEKTAYYVGLS